MEISSYRKYYLLGLIVLVILIFQAIYGLPWTPLLELQNNQIYKQVTGYILFLMIGLQWYLGISRHKDKQFKNKIFWHKNVGLFLPIFFYIHAIQYGHAYQALIWTIFILNCATAYLSPDVIQLKFRLWRLSWFILHIALSSTLTILLCYHLYIVYNYS